MATGRDFAFERQPAAAARRDEQTRAQLAFHEDGICHDCGCSGHVVTVLVYIDDPAAAAWVIRDPRRAVEHVVDAGWRTAGRGIAPVQYVVCTRCRTFWFLGLSVLTAWVHEENLATWRFYAELLGRLTYLPERAPRMLFEGEDDEPPGLREQEV